MKITIDTKEDSPEEIKKIIKMLYSLVEGKEIFSNQGNMFNDNNSDTPEQGNLLSNLFGSSEEKKEDEQKNRKDTPQIREYV